MRVGSGVGVMVDVGVNVGVFVGRSVGVDAGVYVGAFVGVQVKVGGKSGESVGLIKVVVDATVLSAIPITGTFEVCRWDSTPGEVALLENPSEARTGGRGK